MKVSRKSIEDSLKYLEAIEENHKKLMDFCYERAKKLIPYFKPPYINPYSRYLADEPQITEFGVKLRNVNPHASLWGGTSTCILEWKYIEMTEEELEQEILRKEEEKKQKEIAELECKIAKLKQ